MATRTYTYTFTGTEPNGYTYITDTLPSWTGTWQFQVTLSAPAPSSAYNHQLDFNRTADSTRCNRFGLGFATGATNYGPLVNTVGTGSPLWLCTNWTQITMHASPGLPTGPPGTTITWTISGANVPAQIPCPYGTEPATTAPAIAFVTDALITTACTLIGAPWLGILFAPLIGYAIDVGSVCTSGPPPVGPFGNSDLLEAIQEKLADFENVLWYSVCKCKDGPGSPVPPLPPVPTQPTGWPPDTTYSCDPAALCATLQLILKRLDQLAQTTSTDLDTDTWLQQFQRPRAYVVGAAHTGLTGASTWTISQLLGLRFVVTAGLPGRQLEGNPPYYWDVGWMSVSDGGGMLQETRLTRSSFDWIPAQCELATIAGLYLKTGVVGTLTELKRGS